MTFTSPIINNDWCGCVLFEQVREIDPSIAIPKELECTENLDVQTDEQRGGHGFVEVPLSPEEHEGNLNDDVSSFRGGASSTAVAKLVRFGR